MDYVCFSFLWATLRYSRGKQTGATYRIEKFWSAKKGYLIPGREFPLHFIVV